MPASPRAGSSGGAKRSRSATTGSSGSASATVRVYLLTGSETGRKTSEARALIERHVDPDFVDFDAETVDGNGATADRILSAAGTVALGGGRRAVLVRDTQQMETEEQKRLAAGLDRLPESALLILHTGAPVVEDGKTKRQSVVATDLLNAVKKAGEVRDFAQPKSAEDIRTRAASEAERNGKRLAPDALALLAGLPPDDVGRLAAEVAKAAAHAGAADVITGADVEAVLSRGPDDVIFKLCDAVGMRRRQEALGHVSTLFRGGGRPESVAPRALVLLARQVRLLAQFRYLGEKRYAGRGAGPIPPEVLAMLPNDGAGGMLANPRMSWMADKYVAQARNFSGGELAERLEKLLQADLMLKGVLPGGDSPQAVLQRLVIELC
jgi:DNA polymerase III, delta subunit